MWREPSPRIATTNEMKRRQCPSGNYSSPTSSALKEKNRPDTIFFDTIFFMPTRQKSNFFSTSTGFTLMELLVVIAIISLLAGIILSSLRAAREAANIAVAGEQQRRMSVAIELYFDDMGFYPPDVNRGWDPGFTRALPWSPDEEAGESTWGAGINCSHCPSNWQNIVQARWKGPYMPTWPRFTPWKGKYDYNYWGDGADRYGCALPPGIYVGVQGDYNNKNIIPELSEEKMIEKGFDAEQCINGESQMLLWLLE